ncbi:MAG: glutamate synthase small subunit, partial [Phycisphaerae bacterium]
ISQIVYNVTDEPITAIIPYGKADLLLGVDILEAARALDPRGRGRVASKDRTAAVINTYKAQTILGVMGREDFDPDDLEKLIRRYTRDDGFLARDISGICEKYLGSKLYANIMMIGFAFQKGLIPVSMHSIAWAIKDTIRADFRKNIFAFNMGRKLCERMDIFQGAPRRTGWKETLDEKCRHTHRRRGAASAEQLRELVSGACVSAANLNETLKRDIAIRAYDCLRWGGVSYARRYIEQVLAIYAKDRNEFDYLATRAVIHQLASAMLIRDGIFLAELTTSPEKYARDREKYNVNPAHGDKLRYRHHWNWSLKLLGRTFRFNHTVYPWMLRLIKRMRWARKLMPNWHAAEKKYLDRYEQAVENFGFRSYDEYLRKATRLSSARCLHCQEPSCAEAGCPLENRIPEWVDLAYDQKWRQAAEVLHSTNNFPEFTAHICPAPCQDACKRAFGGYPVQIRDLERQIIEKAFDEGWISPQPPAADTGKRVAVVGSGPAGLAAAQQLARQGHHVDVFEREDRVGGLMRYGIPEPRLAKKLIDRRVEQLRAEGVHFHTGVEVGRQLSCESLRGDYDAVLLAVGAPQPRDLNVPGRRRNGVYFAMDFLRQQNLRTAGDYVDEAINVNGKVVTVIGGGLTGEDCVEAALSQGAREVHQFEILPRRSAAAAGPSDAEIAEDLDGVNRQWCVATKAFEGTDDQRLGEVKAVRVQWVPSPEGPVMKEVAGSEFALETDVAVLALGFEAVPDPTLVEQLELQTDPVGRLSVRNYRTSEKKVFAAGDLVTGAAYVVTAIDSGRKAAAAIDEFLQAPPVSHRAAAAQPALSAE